MTISKGKEQRIRAILHQLEKALCKDVTGGQPPIPASQIAMGLDDLIGLPRLKQMAKRDIKACLSVGEVFPHTGLFGPGGLGKTAFAMAMAKDLGYYFIQVEGAAVKTREQLIGLLKRSSDYARSINKNLLFFVDECHRLGSMQEVLYYPMVEWRVTTMDGDISLAPFTLVAATTHPNMLMGSFISRLQNQWHLDRYDIVSMRSIIARQLDKWGLAYDFFIVDKIAQRSLGVPRHALSLCLKVRNAVLARGSRRVTDHDCVETFELEGIDELGLGEQHVKYLLELFNAQGVPKGLSALAGRLGLSEDVVSGSVEPTLLSLGMIDLTGRGRVLTQKGHLHLAQSGIL